MVENNQQLLITWQNVDNYVNKLTIMAIYKQM
jgi:hypothetical protein